MIDSQFIPNLVMSINIKMGFLTKVISELFIKSYIFKNYGAVKVGTLPPFDI